MQHHTHICKNGLAAVVAESHVSPLVSVQVWVETGSSLEGKHLGSGISHLLEHQVFKGTEEFDGETLNRRVPELGGSWNAYTSTDRTVYHITGPSEHWRKFLHLLVQLVFHPSFPEEGFESERDVIRREMDMVNDRPEYAAYYSLLQTVYKSGADRVPVIGYLDAFNSLTYRDMVEYHRERYVPGNVFVCVAGDVDPADLFSAVDLEAGDIPAAPVPVVAPAAEPRQWGPRLFRREFAQPDSTLMLAWRIPSANHPDAAALSMLSHAVGGGRSSLLRKRFHDGDGIAHDVSSAVLTSRCGGVFVIDAEVDRDKRDVLRDSLLGFVDGLRHAGLDADADRARRRMRFSRMEGLTQVGNAAAELGRAWHLTRNVGFMDEWDSALGRLSGADLAAVAGKYLLRDALCEVSVDPVGTNASPCTGRAEDRGDGGIASYTLPNGMRLSVKRDGRVPVVHATLSALAGSPTETFANAGINSLMVECMLKGTENRSAAEVSNAVERLGGRIGGSAGENTVSLYVDGMSGDAWELLEVLADVAMHPAFSSDAVDREKAAMVANIRSEEEDPVSLSLRRVRNLCFGDVSYGNPSGGRVDSVQAVTRGDLARQHKRLFRAGNTVLSIVGDVDPDTVRKQVERLFSGMREGGAPDLVSTPSQGSSETAEPGNKEQAVVVLAVPACAVADKREAEQMLFCEWCNDMSGPTFMEIREKRGLAYYVKARALYGMDAGCLFFYMGTEHGKCAQAREVLEDVVDRLSAGGMPECALERSKASLLHSLAVEEQSGRSVCAGMAVDEAVGLGADHAGKLKEMIGRVTVESMSAYMAEVLSPSGTRTWFTLGGRK